MPHFNRLVATAACLALLACSAQHEAAEQRDAAQYHDQQRDESYCATHGFLPGSNDFKTCLGLVEGQPPAQPRP